MVDFAMVPGSPDEAVVARQHAEQIWRVSLSGAFSPVLYGDLTSYVSGGGEEQGLLSVAFSPNFASDGRVYVYYTEGSTQTVLSRFQVSGGSMVTAAPGAETRILQIPDIASNHNGGKIVFGQGGYLYLSTGDGGFGGDPNEYGQDPNSLLGKVLRINVTGVTSLPYYTIPPDNPFVGGAGLDEIFAYGFRNPWRMSMDSATGVIWLGDVGQSAWEEVEPVVKGGNYGWDCYEGFTLFEATDCPAGGFIFPRAVYDHSGGNQAVAGGYVYRGSSMPELYGWYVYADVYSGRIWAVDAAAGTTSPPVLLRDSDCIIPSFAERSDGELFVLSFGGAGCNTGIYLLQSDGDADGLPAHLDNCPATANAAQTDANGNLHGDICEASGTGNVNCDDAVDSVDALAVLRRSAALSVTQTEPCLDLGQALTSAWAMGDVDCSGGVNSIDALKVLRAAASLPVNLPVGCPAIKP
jgi:glucose/arabinose dehydrogenase